MSQVVNMQTTKIQHEIVCSDDTVIVSTLFQPQNSTIKGAVMLAPATGIKQTFYFAFANWLAQQGYTTITFDNRGIGKSLVGHVKHSRASIQEWGEFDMPAVLKMLMSKEPHVNYHLIGHSAGGQLVGLMQNASSLSSIFNFACSSGNLSQMSYPFKIQALFFMNVFIPLSNLVFGYTKSHWVGMGESLPKAAAKQWTHWCNGSGYAKTDFGHSIKKHWYDDLELPSLWLYADDDPIANQDNVIEMMNVYSNSASEIYPLNPKILGHKNIGHMGFFSRSCSDLWPLALKWLNQHS